MKMPDAACALCEVPDRAKRHPNRAKRQVFPVGGARFREARFTAGLSLTACAQLLRVSERTVRNWESGATRVPYAAFKLLRLLRSGRVLDGPWSGFYVRRDVLVTPEGHEFAAGDLAWWSLLVRQAREYRTARRALADLQTERARAVAVHARERVPTAACARPHGGPERAPHGSDHPPQDATLDHVAGALVRSADRECVEKIRLPGLPSSNRGVSETERLAQESVPSPCKPSAPALPKAGAGARHRLPAALGVAS